MPTLADPLVALRARLRDLWRRATPAARWEAPMTPTQETHLVAIGRDGKHATLATFKRAADADLAAALRNAAPLLWRALDDARAARAVPVLGTVGPDGAVAWRGTPPDAVAASA